MAVSLRDYLGNAASAQVGEDAVESIAGARSDGGRAYVTVVLRRGCHVFV